MKYFIGFAFYLCFIFTFVLTADSNGFSENVLWTDYESAIEDKSKPSIIILHKAWCPACKNLKPKLADSSEFETLSAQFSMVNANENDPIHNLGDFNLDGGYIPRIFFLDSAGQVLSEIENTQGNPKYKYFYHNAESVIASMKKVLEKPNEDDIKKEL